MLTEQDAQNLMIRLIELRQKILEQPTPELKQELRKHETLCIEKFRYLVTMRTNRYKAFNNYDDLNQEGFEALIKAMKNYNPKKGSWFWWAHKYIDTRIARSANLHTTIRYPLKVAKEQIPHKETVMPIMIEEFRCPDKELEETETSNIIQRAIKTLPIQQQEIVNLAFGFNGTKPLSVNKICKKLHLSRSFCLRSIITALSTMKDQIQF